MELPGGLCGTWGNVQIKLQGTTILPFQSICYGNGEANEEGRNKRPPIKRPLKTGGRRTVLDEPKVSKMGSTLGMAMRLLMQATVSESDGCSATVCWQTKLSCSTSGMELVMLILFPVIF